MDDVSNKRRNRRREFRDRVRSEWDEYLDDQSMDKQEQMDLERDKILDEDLDDQVGGHRGDARHLDEEYWPTTVNLNIGSYTNSVSLMSKARSEPPAPKGAGFRG
jgi:hypothetical protein